MNEGSDKMSSRGFTLIELAIVLVIVGLVIVGLLMGRSMVEDAVLHKFMADIEQRGAAVNAFQGKYGYLPGDIPDISGVFAQWTALWGVQPGNGDGQIGGYDPAGTVLHDFTPPDSEIWSGATEIFTLGFIPPAKTGTYSSLGTGGYPYLVTISGVHYFRVGTFAWNGANGWVMDDTGYLFTPQQAKRVSDKLGTGSPNAPGRVITPSTNPTVRPASLGVDLNNSTTNEVGNGGDCWIAATNQWNIASSALSCNLLIRMN